MSENESAFEQVKSVVVKALGVEDRLESLTPDTPLIDSMPEFDSMAVLNVILALEEHFGLTIDNDEVSGELFETLGTLTRFVESKLQ